MKRILQSIVIAILMTFSTAPATADVTFSSSVIADFEFSILSGGPLGGAGFPTDVFIPFQAQGDLIFSLDDSVNTPGVTSAPFTNATGTLDGVSPMPFLPFAITPFEFLAGDLTNIARDGGGNIISATIENLLMRWEMIADPGGAGNPIRLYTQDGLRFDATTEGVPFNAGTTLAGSLDFNVFLDTGQGAGDPLAVIGRNRFITVIPEPVTTILLLPLGMYALNRRRR